ncbi:MAG: hypothetical protein KJ053_07430 [Dehalococcoidia bacterium]|nr:hypothetical protein [Dehalococcoidia bacterium]
MPCFRFALGALLALSLAAVACSDKPGGGDSTGPGDDAQPAPAAGLDSLRRFAESLGNDTYRLVYEVTGSGAKKGKLAATLTMAADPPRQALGLSGEFEGKTATFVLINDGKSSFVCAESGGPGRCLKGESSSPVTIPLPALLDVEPLLERISADTGAEVRPARDRRIAGHDARCWEVEGADGEGVFCVARSDGTLLLLEGDFDGASFAMTAQEVGQPSGKDFEPPFPVVEFGP